MTEMIRCPVMTVMGPCKSRHRTFSALFGHLYYRHRKAEVVKTMIDLMKVADLDALTRKRKWCMRAAHELDREARRQG